MDAHKKGVQEIFTNSRQLIVPFYQRSYVWKEDQWERFVKDMEYITEVKKDYFFGSVILKQQHTNTDVITDKRTIIDGQQRLTTLCIYAKALSIRNNEPDLTHLFKCKKYTGEVVGNSIVHSMLDRRSFDYMMTGSSEESADESIKNNNITKAYNYFLKKIDVSKVDFKTIIDHLQFVVIDLVNDEDEQQIFDTINSLGVKLTTAELLKNYLFDEDSKNKYEEKWYPTFEKEQEIIDFWDEDITTGRLKKTNLDNLLYCYLQIKIKEKGVSSETRANHFRRWDGLFENFKNLVNEYDVSKEELISDITTYAELYRANLISSNASKISLIPESGIERVNFLIWQLDCTTVIPYVLFVLKEINEDKEEQTKIFEYLETYLMRRVFANSSNNSYSDLFSFHLLGNDGKSAESLKAYIISKEGFDIGMPTNEQVIKGTEDHTWRNSKALVVLYMIESKRYDRERSSTDLKSYSEFSLEHLMPRKSDKWLMSEDVTDEMRKKAIYSLGNMAMITQSLNASISNSEWSIKKAGNGKNFGLEKYTTGLETMKGVLDKEVWDEATISDRSKQLGKEATEIWCI